MAKIPLNYVTVFKTSPEFFLRKHGQKYLRTKQHFAKPILNYFNRWKKKKKKKKPRNARERNLVSSSIIVVHQFVNKTDELINKTNWWTPINNMYIHFVMFISSFRPRLGFIRPRPGYIQTTTSYTCQIPDISV